MNTGLPEAVNPATDAGPITGHHFLPREKQGEYACKDCGSLVSVVGGWWADSFIGDRVCPGDKGGR